MQDERPATAHVPDAEKRRATVLKCDIADSTQLNHSLSLEGQLEFKRGWEALVTECARPQGGEVLRFEGDGAMVVFGLTGSEDAAESAVRMGLALIDAVRAARFVKDTQVQVRVGIATGVVAVLNRLHVPKSESVAGTTIDMAERLRAQAGRSQLVISDATRRQAGEFFQYEAVGPLSLKGFGDGVVAWRVLGPSAVISRFWAQRAHNAPARIVGRSEALNTLSDAWRGVAGGKGQAVLLKGDAGMGKSRLATTVLQQASAEGAVVLEIDCTPSTRNSPLHPVGVLLQRTAGIDARCSAQQRQALARQLVSRYIPEGKVAEALSCLAPLFGFDAAPSLDGPDVARQRTLNTVVQMLGALARQRPLALLCEDLHWVDDTTAQVIQHVAQEIGALGALLIVTSRPEPLAIDASHFTCIDLGPLSPTSAQEMVRTIAAGKPLTDREVEQIVQRCEGVPLVLEEVTRNALESSGGAETLPAGKSPAGKSLPTALELVVQSRLARRPQLTPLLHAASVLGREFSIPLLAEMLPGAAQAIPEDVEVLMRDGLLTASETAADRVQFKHAMICEAVYDTLLAPDRERLHLRAAEVLSARYRGAHDSAPDVVAEHWRKAGHLIEAIAVRLGASRETMARGSYVEAEGHCQAGLAMVEAIEDPARRNDLQLELLVQMGMALTGRHGYSSPKVGEAYLRARAACGEHTDAATRYPIDRALAAYHLVRGALAEGFTLSTQAMVTAEASGRPEFLIDAMSVHCYSTLYFRSLSECRSWIFRCLALYEAKSGRTLTYPVPNDAATAALAILPTVEWLLGDSRACEAAIERGLAHVEALDKDFDRAYMHAWVAGIRTTQRRYPEALHHANVAVEIAKRCLFREWYGTGTLVLLIAKSAMEPSEMELGIAAQMCEAFARENVGLNASWYLWGRALGHRRLGGEAHLAEAAKLLAMAQAVAQMSGETRMDAELRILQSQLDPDPASAGNRLREAFEIAQKQGDVPNALRAAAHALGQSRDAATRELARASLDCLEGRAPYPEEGDWMKERLVSLGKNMASLAAAPVGG